MRLNTKQEQEVLRSIAAVGQLVNMAGDLSATADESNAINSKKAVLSLPEVGNGRER